MTEPERIARLEEHVAQLDKAIEGIKEDIAISRDERKQSMVDGETLRGQLVALNDWLAKHQKWHDARDEVKYKATDIIIAIGMLALALMTFLKRGP
jgi:hypothetical protein